MSVFHRDDILNILIIKFIHGANEMSVLIEIQKLKYQVTIFVNWSEWLACAVTELSVHY